MTTCEPEAHDRIFDLDAEEPLTHKSFGAKLCPCLLLNRVRPEGCFGRVAKQGKTKAPNGWRQELGGT